MKPTLRRIKLPLKEHDKRVSAKSQYLAKIGGNWISGTFSKQWYGWLFAGHCYAMSGHQVNTSDWEELFELVE